MDSNKTVEARAATVAPYAAQLFQTAHELDHTEPDDWEASLEHAVTEMRRLAQALTDYAAREETNR